MFNIPCINYFFHDRPRKENKSCNTKTQAFDIHPNYKDVKVHSSHMGLNKKRPTISDRDDDVTGTHIEIITITRLCNIQ